MLQLAQFFPAGFYQGNPAAPSSIARDGVLRVFQSETCENLFMMRVGVASPVRPHRHANFFSLDGARSFYELKPFIIDREESINGKPPVRSGGYYVDSAGQVPDVPRMISLVINPLEQYEAMAFVPVASGNEIDLGLFKKIDDERAEQIFMSALTLYLLPQIMTEYFMKELRARQLHESAAGPVVQVVSDYLDKTVPAISKHPVNNAVLLECANQLGEASALFGEIGDDGGQVNSLTLQVFALAAIGDERYAGVWQFLEALKRSVDPFKVTRSLQ